MCVGSFAIVLRGDRTQRRQGLDKADGGGFAVTAWRGEHKILLFADR